MLHLIREGDEKMSSKLQMQVTSSAPEDKFKKGKLYLDASNICFTNISKTFGCKSATSPSSEINTFSQKIFCASVKYITKAPKRFVVASTPPPQMRQNKKLTNEVVSSSVFQQDYRKRLLLISEQSSTSLSLSLPQVRHAAR